MLILAPNLILLPGLLICSHPTISLFIPNSAVPLVTGYNFVQTQPCPYCFTETAQFKGHWLYLYAKYYKKFSVILTIPICRLTLMTFPPSLNSLFLSHCSSLFFFSYLLLLLIFSSMYSSGDQLNIFLRAPTSILTPWPLWFATHTYDISFTG